MSDLTVSSILGFEPHQFTTELSSNIDKNLVNHVDRFKKDVKKLITSKGHKVINIYTNIIIGDLFISHLFI